MINELIWDTKFFKRKIGELKASTQSQHEIKTALKLAEEEGYQYLICRIQSQKTLFIKTLETLGFYLSDIGVTWEIETDHFSSRNLRENPVTVTKSPRIATVRDISMLKSMIKSLFPDSRFYNDPFFSKKEADNLYQAWIENSVTGHAADIVFLIPFVGFIACRRPAPDEGEIPLIGVKKGYRGKGIGKALIYEAIYWFKKQNVRFVRVRTQLENINAMNFYANSGFHIREYDMVFARVFR